MNAHDDTALAYLYGRLDNARRALADATLPFDQRRDWGARAEELRQCLRRLEEWRVQKVGTRYQHDVMTVEEIKPPSPTSSEETLAASRIQAGPG